MDVLVFSLRWAVSELANTCLHFPSDRHQRLAAVQGYEAQVIPANHRGMVQFDTNAEPGYIRIKAVLERWIDNLKPKGKADPAPVSQSRF